MVGDDGAAVRAVVEAHDAATEVLRFVKMNSITKVKPRVSDAFFVLPFVKRLATRGVHGRGNQNVAKAVASSRTLVDRLGALSDLLPDDRIRAAAERSNSWPDRLAASVEEFGIVAGEIEDVVDVLAPFRRNADLGRPLTD